MTRVKTDEVTEAAAETTTQRMTSGADDGRATERALAGGGHASERVSTGRGHASDSALADDAEPAAVKQGRPAEPTAAEQRRPGKESYVYDVFQDVAEGYDGANVRISAGQQTRWKRAAVELVCEGLDEDGAKTDADEGRRPQVLDIGCGTGDMLLLVHERRPDAKLCGLDFSPHMLEQARERCAGIPNLSLVEGNACALPFGDDSFDGATIAFALRNTADYEGVLREALRVLRPGARFVCIDSFVPTNPLVKPLYHLYFSVVMPLLGGGIRKFGRYRWLSRSTKEFLSVAGLSDLMAKVGFVHMRQRSFMFGACACVMGECAEKVPPQREAS